MPCLALHLGKLPRQVGGSKAAFFRFLTPTRGHSLNLEFALHTCKGIYSSTA